jgi:hypothetical protein
MEGRKDDSRKGVKKTEGEAHTQKGRRREIGNCLRIRPSDVRGKRDEIRYCIAEEAT